MPLIERYLLRQLIWPTLLASAALLGIAILSQSLSALDLLVDERQSAWLYAKVVLLATPQLLIIVLPIAVLIAALTALNRLHTEQEVVICYAAGMSRSRVIVPGVLLALAVTLVCFVLTLWLQPLAFRTMRQTLQQVRTDAAATLIRPGRFTHPAPGVTVFAERVEDDGRIDNLFIDRVDAKGRDNTLTARHGLLITRGAAPMLVLRDGTNQEFTPKGVLNFLSFDEYILDLRPLFAFDHAVRYKLSDRYPHELFFPDPADRWAQANRGKLVAEGHFRFSAPLYVAAFMLVAAAAVLGGPFSKPGYAARIALAVAVAVLARTLGFALQAAAGSAPWLNLAQYLVPIALAAGAAALVFHWRWPSPGRHALRRATLA